MANKTITILCLTCGKKRKVTKEEARKELGPAFIERPRFMAKEQEIFECDECLKNSFMDNPNTVIVNSKEDIVSMGNAYKFMFDKFFEVVVEEEKGEK